MVNKRNALPMLALAVCLASSAAAQSTNTGKAQVTVSDLDAIMQEEIVLKAMANRAKQRAELGRYNGAAQDTILADHSLPQLAWRRSTATGWLAKFVLDNGASLIAGVGERLPGDLEIAQIDERGVKLKRGGEIIELTAAASGARPSTEAGRPEPPRPSAIPLSIPQ